MRFMAYLYAQIKLFLIYNLISINISSKNEELKVFIKESDVLRAKENILKYEWAKNLERSIIETAKGRVKKFTDEYLKNMISEITPTTTTMCPNCIKKGLKWNVGGQWSWNVGTPDKIKCNVCQMEFPNDEYKETIKRVSNWNSTQIISYVDMEGQKCFSYNGCKSTISGIIRANKLQYIIRNLDSVAYAYQLTKNITYANLIKKVFNRLASVLPSYLIYAGYSYNEYADCDPKYVAENIYNLTKDPNQNCRLLKSYEIENNPKELYGGYWTASRLGTNGMDGTFAYLLSMVYDLIKETCTENEKKNYEKNILEQITYLGINDNSNNNKAVANMKGVSVVGLAINNVNMIRFGLKGFIKAVDKNMFLKDGGPSESAAYTMQTLGGLYEFGFAFRNYSDPEDYNPSEGEIKYKNFDCMVDTRYYECYQCLIWTTYGNYYYPSIADSYNTTKIRNNFIEYINYAKPVEKEYLNERLKTFKPTYYSLFFRNSELENITKNFTHPDIVFPFLSQGYLRTGNYGEKSLIVLDASPYGSHHHLDSLNLVFWKEGHELLVDLGYLLDHEFLSETKHTYNHNTVYVNNKEQISTGRNGSFSTFFNSSKIKVMQAGSNAYKECDVYNRTIIQIEHMDNSSYFVDIFRVHGGRKRLYTFHGPNNNYALNSDLKFNQIDQEYVRFIFLLDLYEFGYIEIKDVFLTEDNSTDNMVSEFPKNYSKKPCPVEYTWCHYIGDGKAIIEVNDTFKLTATKKDPNNNKVNVGISIGNSDGYRAKNAFYKKIGQKFTLKFKMRGSALPVLYLLYWDNDESSTRVYYKTPNLNKISEEYQDYSFEFILGEKKYQKYKKYGITNKPWDIKWNINDDYIFNVYFPKKINQKVYFESGFGQRDYKNSDYGAKLPYFYVDGSEDSNSYSTFVAVYEAHNKTSENIVKSVTIDDKFNGNIGIKIKTKDGEDFVLSATDNNTISSFGLKTDATVYVKITNKDKNNYLCLGGTFCDNIKFKQKEFNGYTKIFKNEINNSYFEIESDLKKENIIGQSLQIIGGDNIMRTYPIFKVENIKKGLRLYTRFNSRGFRVYENVYWRIQNIELTEDEEKDNLSGFCIFLIIVGIIIIFAIIIFIIYHYYKKKKEKRLLDNDDDFMKLIN